jgi:hypothetical protein
MEKRIEENSPELEAISKLTKTILYMPDGVFKEGSHLGDGFNIHSLDELKKRASLKCVSYLNQAFHGEISFNDAEYEIQILLDGITASGYAKYVEDRIRPLFEEIKRVYRELDNETIERIEIFASTGRAENTEAVIALLKGYEFSIDALRHIEKKAPIIRIIKEKGFLNGIDHVPSDKTLVETLDSYRTTHYPKLKKEEKEK